MRRTVAAFVTANAAVRGARAGGATTTLVNDSHGSIGLSVRQA